MKETASKVIYLNHDELESALRLCYRAEMEAKKAGSFVRLPAIIWGDVGIGKTSVAREAAKVIAEQFTDKNIKSGFWSLSLAIKDSVDVGGFTVPDHDKRTMVYFPPEDIPYVNMRLENPEKPYGIFVLDDIDRADLQTRNAALCLLLDRMLNNNPISPNVYVCATANGEADAGSTFDLGNALGNRGVHLYLRPGDGWSDFLKDDDISAIEQMLPMEDTEFREKAQCRPRSVEMAKWIKLARRDESPIVFRACINGCVGADAGAILCKAMNRTFKLADILNGVPIDVDHITFDDIDMLCRELNCVKKTAQKTVKDAVMKWAVDINPEFSNIIVAQIHNW